MDVGPTSLFEPDRALAGGGGGERPESAADEGLPLVPHVAEDAPSASPPLRRILMAVDVSVLVVGWCVVIGMLALLGEPITAAPAAAEGMVMVVLGALLLSANGLYRRRICSIRSAEVARLGRTSVLMVGVAMLLLAGGTLPGAGLAVAAAASGTGGVAWFALLVAERGILREWIRSRRATGDFRAPVLVLGGDDGAAIRTAAFLAEHPVLGFEVAGVVGSSALRERDPRFTWVGDRGDLVRMAALWNVSGVVLDAGSMTGDELNRVAQELSGANLHVHIASGLQGIDQRRISVAGMADETFLHVAPLTLSRPQVVTKRVVDVALGTLASALALPVLLLSALMIWLYDRGPVLYRQERVGHEGERFVVYKLRTMAVDADQRLADLEAENSRNGPLFKLGSDPRVTPIGRFLRASSIDELPQLFNVLEGTMSLVGPRPALPKEVAQFDEHLTARLTVKPGMTGLWQVEARDLPSFDLYRRFDLLYVQSWSLALDLSIIARTVVVVAMRTLASMTPGTLRRDAQVME